MLLFCFTLKISISDEMIHQNFSAPQYFCLDSILGSSSQKFYIFRGSYYASFGLIYLLNVDQLLKERICSHRSKFFPLRVDPVLEELCNWGSRQEVAKPVSFFSSPERNSRRAIALPPALALPWALAKY